MDHFHHQTAARKRKLTKEMDSMALLRLVIHLRKMSEVVVVEVQVHHHRPDQERGQMVVKRTATVAAAHSINLVAVAHIPIRLVVLVI